MLSGCRTPPPPPPAVETPALQPLAPAQQARAQSLALYSQGLIEESHSRYPQALQCYRQAARLDPTNELLHVHTAMVLVRQQRVPEALTLMERFCDGAELPRRAWYARTPAFQPSEKALYVLVLIQRNAGQLDQVRATFRRLLHDFPQQPAAYVDLAFLEIEAQREPAAIAILERGLQRVSKPPLTLPRLLGELYSRRAAAHPQSRAAARDRQRAIRVLQRAVALAPTDIPTQLQLARGLIQDRQLAAALALFEPIERQLPDNLMVKQRLAECFLGLGNRAQALAAVQDLSRAQPTNGRLAYYLGQLYETGGDRTNALPAYRRATQQPPLEPSPFIKLALLQAGPEPAAAVRTLQEGLRRLPDNPRLVEMTGYLYAAQTNYTQALACFRHVVRLAAERKIKDLNPVFYFNFALTAQRAGHYTDAATCLSKAFERNDGVLEAYVQTLCKAGDEQVLADGSKVLDRTAQLLPDTPALPLAQGLLYSARKDYTNALRVFAKAEALAGDSEPPQREQVLKAGFYFWYGSAAERAGEFERSEKLFFRCLELEPDYTEALNYLAYMWAEKGIKLEQARAFIKKALAKEPQNPAYLDTLGWIYFRQGLFDQALEQIEKAHQLLPDDPTIAEHLGDLALKRGDKAGALQYWRQAFLLEPDNPALAKKLQGHGADLKALRAQAAAQPKPAAGKPNAAGTDQPEETTPLLLMPSPSLTDSPGVEEEEPVPTE